MSQPPGAPAPSIELQGIRPAVIRVIASLRTPGDELPVEVRRRLLRERRLALSVLTSVIAQGATVLVGIISVPLSLHYLGKQWFGLWAAVTSLVVWGSLLDLGISRGLVNALSEAHGRDDEVAASSYLSTAFFGLLGLAVAVAGVAAIIIPAVDWASLLGVSGIPPATVRQSVAAAVVVFVIGLPLGVVQHLYAAYHRLYVFNFFVIAQAVVTLSALAIAVVEHASLPVLILTVGVAGQLVTGVNLLVGTRRTMPWLRLRPRSCSRAAMRRLRQSALPLFLFQAGALLVNETQVIVLSRRTNLGVVADYSVLMRLYLAVTSFIALATTAFAPMFREAHERGEVDWLRRGFRRLLVFRSGLAVAAGTVLIASGNVILDRWVGHSVRLSTTVWIAAAILMLTAVWVTAYSDLLTALDRIWVQVSLVLVNGVVAVALTYALAPSHGVLGVVVASSATSVLLLSWLMPTIARRLLVFEPGTRR